MRIYILTNAPGESNAQPVLETSGFQKQETGKDNSWSVLSGKLNILLSSFLSGTGDKPALEESTASSRLGVGFSGMTELFHLRKPTVSSLNNSMETDITSPKMEK